MKIKFNVMAFLLIATVLSGCGWNGGSKKFDFGHIEQNKYINSYFGMELVIPDGWVARTRKETRKMVNMLYDTVVKNDIKPRVKASEINTADLLSIFKYKIGTSKEYNPGLMLIATNLKNAPHTKTGSDYLSFVRKYLKQRQEVHYMHIDETSKKVMINNQPFYSMSCTINIGININQEYYSTVKDGFSMNVIITYANEQQKKELENIIHSIKFNH
ncbi:MAG: hypothetical protein JXR71_10090 [Bacteroidales bacterium]|nr:hypothetical protein [Bacteroidales bacterium]